MKEKVETPAAAKSVFRYALMALPLVLVIAFVVSAAWAYKSRTVPATADELIPGYTYIEQSPQAKATAERLKLDSKGKPKSDVKILFSRTIPFAELKSEFAEVIKSKRLELTGGFGKEQIMGMALDDWKRIRQRNTGEEYKKTYTFRMLKANPAKELQENAKLIENSRPSQDKFVKIIYKTKRRKYLLYAYVIGKRPITSQLGEIEIKY